MQTDLPDLWRRVRVIEADAGIPGILCSEGHLPEGVFDDSRGVPADPEFEKVCSAAIGPVCLRNAPLFPKQITMRSRSG